MNEENYYKIEAQSYNIIGIGSHDYWVLRDPSGNSISELHGLAYDPVKNTRKTIGTIGDELQFFTFTHYYGDTHNSDSMVLYQGTIEDVFARWNAASDAINYLNNLHLPYTPLGFIDPTGTINSNSAFHIFGEIMGVPIQDFDWVIEPGFDTDLKYILENYETNLHIPQDLNLAPDNVIFIDVNSVNVLAGGTGFDYLNGVVLNAE